VAASQRRTFQDLASQDRGSDFGIKAADLGRGRKAEGIQTKRYYAPPVHTMHAYRSRAGKNGQLPVTEAAAQRVLTLPLWSSMEGPELLTVADTIRRIQRFVGAKG